jgi:hypothetical protein
MERPPVDPSALRAWATDEAAGLVSRVMEASNAQAQALRIELQTLRSRTEMLSLELEEARERADAAESALGHASEHFEETLDELRQEHTATIREQALSCMMLPLDELLTVFNVVERSTTLADALTREFSRVALFAVRANRLEGVQQRGFEFENDISRVTVPLTPDSLLGRSVASGRLESMLLNPAADSSATGVPFGGSPCCAVALPITVRGTIVAVIYADDSDRMEFGSTSPQALIKFAELLLMYSLLVFVRISSEPQSEQVRQRA